MGDFDAVWSKFRGEHVDQLTAEWGERRVKGKRNEDESRGATLIEDRKGGKGTKYFTLVLPNGLGWEHQASIDKLKHRTDEMEKRIRELANGIPGTKRRNTTRNWGTII